MIFIMCLGGGGLLELLFVHSFSDALPVLVFLGICFGLWLLVDTFGTSGTQPVPRNDAWNAYCAGLVTGKGVPLGFVFDSTGNRFTVRYPQDRHIITIGETGSGKNLTVQSLALLEHVSASAFINDPKGQLCAITARRRLECGHVVKAINPFDKLGIPTSTYNPLSHIDAASPSFLSDVRRIVEGIVDVMPGQASHFSVSALDYGTMLTGWVVWVKGDTAFPVQPDGKPAPRDMSLIRVRELINMAPPERMALCDAIAACSFRPIAEAATRYGKGSQDSKEVRDSVETARMQFAILRDPGIERVLRSGPNEICFADLKKRLQTIYIIIPPEALFTHGKFIRLLTLSALGELFKETTQPDEPVLFMLDEFLQLGRMALIESAAAIIRDYRVKLWIILQNLPKTKAAYGDDQAAAFLSAAGVLQTFTPNEMVTAEMLSKRAGTHWEKMYTSSISTSSGPNGGTSNSTSWQLVEQPNWTPGQIMSLRGDQQLLFVPGLSQAILAYRFPYNRMPELAGAYDQDPYHGDAAEFERKARAGEWVIR